MATMDAEKNKKLQQYAVVLTEKAEGEEKSGKHDEAIKHYLKLVDVFLVLAAEAQDHNTWLQYIRQAEAYQSRTRALVPKDQRDPGSRNNVDSQRESPDGSQSSENVQSKLNPLRKMLKPFQRNEEESIGVAPKGLPQQHRSQMQSMIPTQQPPRLSTNIPVENGISPEVYQRVLSENKILRDKISAMTKEVEERIATLERTNKDTEQKISEMVPRADYDALQSEFYNSVPKIEYERVKAELLNSVPKAHYDDLLNRIADMVPKEIYLDAERRTMELESTIKNSTPNKVIEDLASEISLLGLLSEVPLSKPEKTGDSESQEIASTR
ncbi:MAG TPA: hypothetical protein VNE86_03680 [Nitrososphaerales archaeon]|nr:hypothetical protein [Nitrososphaerales archaeon]